MPVCWWNAILLGTQKPCNNIRASAIVTTPCSLESVFMELGCEDWGLSALFLIIIIVWCVYLVYGEGAPARVRQLLNPLSNKSIILDAPILLDWQAHELGGFSCCITHGAALG